MRRMKTAQYLILATIVIVLITNCRKDPPVFVNRTQMLTNGNVESGTGIPEHWWQYDGQGHYQLSWDDKVYFSPLKSLKISSTLFDTNFSYWTQTVVDKLMANKTITLRVKVKAALAGEGISIVIRGDDTVVPQGYAEQFVTTESITMISGNFDWQEYHVSLEKLEPYIKSLSIYLLMLPNTKGEVYFDDVTLSYH